MGISDATFYDRRRVAIVPMAFCFPGYDARGADLPPPRICAATWRETVIAFLPKVRVTLLVGLHAQRWHLARSATSGGLTRAVASWREHAPQVWPLPHPSWRNTGWLKRNPWFGTELLPELRTTLAEVLERE